MASIDKNKFQFVKRDDFASEAIDAPAYSYWRSVIRQFLKKKSTIIMLAILLTIILMSFIYPMLSDFDYNDVSKVNDFSARYIAPNGNYWFGTDVISNIPQLLIVIVLTYSIGAGFWNLIFAMTITSWISIAYLIRVQIMRYRDLEYNLASRTLGTSTFKIVARNIMPQLVSVIMTTSSQMLPSFISYEAFLSFFGLGLPVTVPSLGRLISDYSQNVTTNAYLFWIPLTTLILVSLSLFIVGQNLADASDPRTHR